MDSRFTIASHVLGYLAWRESQGEPWVSSSELGNSISTHSVVVRRVLIKLRSSGLIETRRGSSGGSRLARPADQIHLRDAYDAVMGDDSSLIPIGSASHSGSCPVGHHIESVLREVIAESEVLFRKSLQQTSIAEFATRVARRLHLACQTPPPRMDTTNKVTSKSKR